MHACLMITSTFCTYNLISILLLYNVSQTWIMILSEYAKGSELEFVFTIKSDTYTLWNAWEHTLSSKLLIKTMLRNVRNNALSAWYSTNHFSNIFYCLSKHISKLIAFTTIYTKKLQSPFWLDTWHQPDNVQHGWCHPEECHSNLSTE